MKFSAFAVITAAVAGIGAVPVDSGPLGHLQNRAADAIGGVVSFIRREEAGHAVVPAKLRRSVVRFHNARDEEYLQRRKAEERSNIGIEPFSPVRERDTEEGDGLRQLLGARQKKEEEKVPPLAPFSTVEESGSDLTRRKGPEESVPPLAPFSTS
ncbi:hypothetical protein CSOJ01_14586 [Colletotrichum sojae]|uniref:Uncharacterized protein n=1 Tax=Colletotrichum sojae TaxID=2175907 RepID=A0A8H6IPI7_9PEZI|nr:hypothetical protein CSOJ01_14586 [Colletotrichum sojae]